MKSNAFIYVCVACLSVFNNKKSPFTPKLK